MYNTTLQILRGENWIEKEAGLCFSPLIIFFMSSSFLCTDFLLFRGETSLFASLDGENDLRSLAAADKLAFGGDFLPKPATLAGETNLFASLDGENDLRSLAAPDKFAFGGDFLPKPAALVGDTVTGGLLIFTWNFEALGDLIKNLCGVCLFRAITGDFVLQSFWLCEVGDEWNNGLGKRTVFLTHGLFLGETLFAMYLQFSLSQLFLRGEILKFIFDLARLREGISDEDSDRRACFSLLLRACRLEFCVLSGFCFRLSVNGVLGSSVAGFPALYETASTIVLANRLACIISPIVSPKSIAGNDILRHSSGVTGSFPVGDLRELLPFLTLHKITRNR